MSYSTICSYRHKKPSRLSSTKITNPLLDTSWTPSNENSINLYENLSPHHQTLILDGGRGTSKSTPVSPVYRRKSPGRSASPYAGPSMLQLNPHVFNS